MMTSGRPREASTVRPVYQRHRHLTVTKVDVPFLYRVHFTPAVPITR
jgi:hypothetical protein